MAAGLTDREAAKIAGVSHVAVFKARKAGKIATLPDGTISEDALDTWSKQRRTPRGGAHRDVNEASVNKSPQVSVDGPAADNAKAALDALLSGDMYVTRQAADLARDSYAAHIKRFELEKLRGRVLDRDDTEKWIAAGLSKVRSRFLNLPAEKAPALARCKTAAEVQALLLEAVSEALEELAAHFSKGALRT